MGKERGIWVEFLPPKAVTGDRWSKLRLDRYDKELVGGPRDPDQTPLPYPCEMTTFGRNKSPFYKGCLVSESTRNLPPVSVENVKSVL